MTSALSVSVRTEALAGGIPTDTHAPGPADTRTHHGTSHTPHTRLTGSGIPLPLPHTFLPVLLGIRGELRKSGCGSEIKSRLGKTETKIQTRG